MAVLTHPAVHRRWPDRIELAVLPMPGRAIVSTEIRFFAGCAFEDPAHLGVAHALHEAITKGTAKRNGRELNDAFDAIGATHAAYAGRETMGFQGICLPEFFEQFLRLNAEMICTPSFPDEACEVAIDLTRQALDALEDSPHDLAAKLLHAQAYGEPLGRHSLGTRDTLDAITRESICGHWRRLFTADRMQIAVAGPIDPGEVERLVGEVFSDLPVSGNGDSRPDARVRFAPHRAHHDKDLEQEQIGICFPGAAARDRDFPVEKVTIGVLAGGMSGRLFTEVREKQGLVYWVGAHADHPRNDGMIHLGASTTPQRVDRTYEMLLRELDRLAEDVTEEEVRRAVVGLVARSQTRGDIPRVKATEMVNDLFFYGEIIPMEEKIRRVEAVTVDDVKQFLKDHPRDRLSVLTLGPRRLER